MRRNRRAGQGLRRGGQAVRGEEDARRERGKIARLSQNAAHRLQDAEAYRISAGLAEDQCRQDPASRVAGRGMTDQAAAEVVAFWREAGPKRWFEKDAAFDD